MTLLELRAMVYRRIGDHEAALSDTPSGDSPAVTEVTAEINRSILQVLLELMAHHAPVYLKTQDVSVTSGTQEYNLATDYFRFWYAERTDTTPNQDCSLPANADLRNRLKTLRSGERRGLGPPLYLSHTGDATNPWKVGLVTSPVETMTIRVYYVPIPADLSNDADTPEPNIPVEYHEVAGQLATVNLLADENSQAAQVQSAKLGSLWERMIDTCQETQHATTGTVRRLRG